MSALQCIAWFLTDGQSLNIAFAVSVTGRSEQIFIHQLVVVVESISRSLLASIGKGIGEGGGGYTKKRSLKAEDS